MSEPIKGSDAEPKREEERIKKSTKLLESAKEYLGSANPQEAPLRVATALDEFFAAYTAKCNAPSDDDAKRFLTAVEWVLQAEKDEPSKKRIQKDIVGKIVGKYFESAGIALDEKNGTEAKSRIVRSWNFKRSLFPEDTNMPPEEFNAYVTQMLDMVENKTPHIDLAKEISSLRESYKLTDSEWSKVDQVNMARDMIVDLLSQVVALSFMEKREAGEDVGGRNLRQMFTGMAVNKWEQGPFKYAQTKEWVAKYDAIRQRLRDIAQGN